MISRVLITFFILLYAAGVPYLEVSATHIFNPDWAAHAKLHNVWQLITNSLFGIVCLWLLWIKNDVRTPALLSGLVIGSFMLAYFLRGFYGGSMVHTDGSEIVVFGQLNIAVLAFGVGTIILAVVYWLNVFSHKSTTSKSHK